MNSVIRFTAFLISLSVGIDISANSDSMTLIATDGTTVTINRDYFGVPHITADTEVGVFFGQGFAAAEDRLAQMELNRLAAEGKLSELYGDSYLDHDMYIRTMYYTETERKQIFNSLPAAIQKMYEAYTDGVNTFLDSMEVNPSKYKPQEFEMYNYDMEQWNVYKSVALAQYILRQFGQFGGKELERLSELQSYGQSWFDQNRPINDPDAPTTIPNGNGPLARQWRYSDISVREEVIKSFIFRKQKIEEQANSLGLPRKFGSFATVITGAKSNTGNVMLLGCPQMGAPKKSEPQINHEVELNCPTLHAAGAAIAGFPSIHIGHNEYQSWTFTSGYTDNCDIYIDSTQDNSYSKYYYAGEWLDFEVIKDTIISSGTEHYFTHYRTIHGPVFGDDLENHQVFSLKMTFWKEELDMMKFIDGIIRATNLSEFETAASINPLSFNLFYAGKDQNVKYWHTGKYQDRSDGVDPRLPHKGSGGEEWNGFIPFENLPAAANPVQGYFVNWNNKPVSWWNNGDNVPFVGSQHVTKIDNYVKPISSFTYGNLKDIPIRIDDHGTYQQAIELTETEIIDENIVPPGQSAFIDLNGNKSQHFDDQWQLHTYWRFKDQLFNYQPGDDPYPRIVFDETRINIGEILISSNNVDTTFYIYNTGKSVDSITITMIYGNADSTAVSVEPAQFTVAAGDSIPITYTVVPSLLSQRSYSTTLMLDAKYSPSKFHFKRNVVFRVLELTPVEEISDAIPVSLSLEQNYPNPFNPATKIQYSIPVAAPSASASLSINSVEGRVVTLKIYDILGREVETLVNEKQKPGSYEVEFSAKGRSAYGGDGSKLSSGIYLYRLRAGEYVETKKMILLK